MMTFKACELKRKKRVRNSSLPMEQRRSSFDLVEEGFIHHASMVHGDQRAPLRRACEFLDIRPVVVE